MRYTLSSLFTFLLLLLIPQSQADITSDKHTQKGDGFIGYSCKLAGAQSINSQHSYKNRLHLDHYWSYY